MKKFAFIGAGSMVFTRNLVMDLLHFEHFRDAELCLMDIDEKRLAYAEKCVEKVVRTMQVPAHITTTTDRRRALEGADGVVCTVFNGDTDISKLEVDIPYQFGVSMNIGDTRSVGGIFRALRNIPLMLDICRDIEKYCPNAVFLNYTNPMSMLCKAMQTETNVEVTGLCHSVQGTVAMLAEWLETPVDEIDYLCAGVNHQAFYLKLEHNGQDLYPKLAKKLEAPEFYNKEQVRNEMFRHLGYYVTESSGHNSEYNAWFRKRPDLIENYCTHSTNWNPGLHAFSLNSRLERAGSWKQEITDWIENEPVDTNRSSEYAANIFNSRFGDRTPFKFNGNVINDGSITNLPYDACVEIPVFADKDGIHKTIVGELPAHLAILVSTTAQIENLVVRAAMTKSREDVYHAVMMDPLCSAVCSLQEIRNMCDLIFEKNTDYLGDYK